jgi:hypothetical protein
VRRVVAARRLPAVGGYVRVRAVGPVRNAFLIVYSGGFPTGDTVITTTFDDGRTRRDVQPNFGF